MMIAMGKAAVVISRNFGVSKLAVSETLLFLLVVVAAAALAVAFALCWSLFVVKC